jgi:glycosyltransferase involved in cell wall biosynthesis
MQTFPRISIVTPSYNQAKYLPETIESILRQDYPNLEYIIIDGGSSDESVDVIKRYESHLAYWVSERDSGQSEAINKGVKRATGDLFNWINADDILFPGALRRIAEAFVQNPDADLIVGDHARGGVEGKITRVSAAPSRITLSSGGWPLWVGQQSIFVSLSTLKRIGWIREDLHCVMDAELYHRILAAGGRLARAKGLIGLLRDHLEAKHAARKAEWAPEKERVLKECGIRPSRVEMARAKLRFWRILDGSHVRSWCLSRQWRGRHPWNGTAYYEEGA